MQAAGTHRYRFAARVASGAIIIAALAFGIYVLERSAAFPTTDDASIDADVTHIAAAVGGRIIAIPVAENAAVAKGDVMFQIDPLPYQLGVEQARADLELAQATLETQRRAISTQQSAASIAADQTRRAQTNLAEAQRTVDRLQPLEAKGYVPTQQLDQARTLARDAATSLAQAQIQEAAAVEAINTDAGAEATVRARKAALAIAERALRDTTVPAPHAGRVSGLTVSTGEMVAPSQPLFALVNTKTWFATANFRETDLAPIAVDDCATVFSMIDRSRPVKGVVQGLGAAVLDTERVNLPMGIPYVQNSLNWVQVAQRFPVRIRLEDPPQELMRMGASAVVEVKHGAACK